MNNDLISRAEILKAFGLSEKTRKYGGDHSGYNSLMLYEIQYIIENMESVSAVPLSVIDDIKAEIDECYRQADDIAYAEGLEMAELIIDEHIGKENDNETDK